MRAPSAAIAALVACLFPGAMSGAQPPDVAAPPGKVAPPATPRPKTEPEPPPPRPPPKPAGTSMSPPRVVPPSQAPLAPRTGRPPVPIVARAPPARDAALPEGTTGLVIFLLRKAADADAVARGAGLDLTETAELPAIGLRMAVARLRPGDTPTEAVRRLEGRPEVAWAQPDHRYQSLAGPAPPTAFVLHGLAAAPAATGLVAMIDTMAPRDHEVFRGAALQQRFFRSPVAPAAHGAAVASLIVGRSSVQGAARGARLINLVAFVQATPEGPPLSETRHLARALDAAIALQPNVLNLSFGGPEDRLLARLVETADTRGICVVAAAGNGGPGARTPFPASHPKVLGVTAIDERLALYPWATPGPAVDVAALGVDLVAAVPGGYRRVSGSSYAAAIVSGALARTAACARDRNPAAMRAAVAKAALDLGAPGVDPRFGAGLFRLPAR